MGACSSKHSVKKRSNYRNDLINKHADSNESFKVKGNVSEIASTASGRSLAPLEEFIDWSDIHLTATTIEDVVIGIGSFGSVIRATWVLRNSDGSVKEAADVAVKVLSRTCAQVASDDAYKMICQRAIEEVVLLNEAERSIGSSERLVKAYGVAKGKLPKSLVKLFDIVGDTDGVGIIMRYESGGSLEALLHSKQARQSSPLKLEEKLYLLKGIAHSLAELHSVGIVHADIKPENVLLSHHQPPQVRLADFGLSILQDVPFGQSSLATTSHLRGTPVYCAPELLVNPYEEFEGIVAKSSRKTDMYAFAMLAWEVLTQKRPFADLKSDGVLCCRVHKGIRPDISQLPPTTPTDITAMIELCWDKDRSTRLSAIECLAILHYQCDLVSGKRFDIFLSHAPSIRPLLSHISHALTLGGLRVWFDRADDTSTSDPSFIKPASREGMGKCTAVAGCLTRDYVNNFNCMNELRMARISFSPRPVILLLLEDNPDEWAVGELLELCPLDTTTVLDLREHMKELKAWSVDEVELGGGAETGPKFDTKLLNKLCRALVPLTDFISQQNIP